MLRIKRHACAVALFAVSIVVLIPLQAQAQLGSLIVTMSSPASGSTVSGTVPVSASVSIIGLLTVSGVQFQVDGANLGAEDTSAPYAVSWNTTTAGDGTHTLTAVARDILGIRYTSNAVTVTVSNAAPPPPADTTPPTVSITSPANGATVRGTVSVSANASDNVGVVGVQFLLDNGVNGSAEATTAPYSISWDTATAGDGSHTITAIARDAAGNQTTSAPVTVTVANNAPPPPPASGARFEETDPSVTFIPNGGWSQDGSRSWSGGGAALSTTPGAQATFTFTGPSVTWIGGRAPGTGIARISLDGVLLREVDTYSKTEEVRVSMFTASGLANTSHTLTIEVTGRQNPAATAAFIFVDAFDVPAAAVSRLQETDPDIAYSPVAGWTQGNTERAWSAGFAAVSATAGARATFNFTGTGISWIGARGTQTGIARVTLDGVVTTVNTYSPAEQIQAAVFTATGLADTSHALTIEVTGQQDPASSSPLIVVDAFEVTLSGTRHQDTDPAVAYGDGWAQDNRDKAYSEGATAESNVTGAQATISFTGTGIRWIGARGPQTGRARVLLDGNVAADSIDTLAMTEGPQHTNFFASGLANTSHTLTIQVLDKNPLATNGWILIDAFDVIP
jgi:Big-like domain-containing protein